MKLKKIFAAALAAAIGLTGITSAASSDTTTQNDTQYYKVSDSTIKNLSTTEPTKVETGIDGISLTIGADTYEYKADTNIKPFSGRIYGKNNPKPAEGTGTYYIISLDETIPNGEISVGIQVGAEKSFYILDNGTALKNFDGIKYNAKTTASIPFNVEGGHTYTVYAAGTKLGFYGFSYRQVDKVKDFKAEIEGLTFDLIKGENVSADSIDSDLNLPQSYESKFGACDVSWKSSMTDVIANNGTVSCQAAAQTVTLTGTFSVQEDDSLSCDKVFTLKTVADADDDAAVQAAADALTLGDVSSLKSSIVLPSSGKRGTKISWSSSDENVIKSDGTITRAPSEDKTAVLTATITRDAASTTKTFNVTVKGYVAVEFNGYVYGDTKGNDSFKPVDGGTLKTVLFTESIQNRTGDEVIVCATFNANNTIKDVKVLKIMDITSGSDMLSYAEINLPFNSTDKFKVLAFSSMSDISPYVEPLAPNDTVADGATIYVVGDSTAAPYTANEYPKYGWAQALGNFFDDVKVVDLALSGRSSLSFKKDTNFATLKNKIKKGDYLIIQFGHNDEKNEVDRYTDPSGDRFTEGSYKHSLMEYVEIAQNVGATPIIATSISRRRTSDSGLEKYAKAARELAEELHIPLIDLYSKTNTWINEVGLDNAIDMFNYVKPYDSRFINDSNFKSSQYYTKGTTDNTHININGANLISQWATEEMQRINMPLGDKVNSYKATYPLPSYADAASTN